MSHSVIKNRRLARGKALGAAVLVVALLAVLGFAAYRFFFNRPGEAAAMLIPSDADLVITLDTNPSERQVATFKKISDALEREGIAQNLDEMLKGFLEGKPIGQEIRPHLKRSFAMGMWMGDQSQSDVVTLCAVDDPAAVQKALETYGIKKSDGIFEIPGTNRQMVGRIVESYLAISNTEEALGRVEKVRDKSAESVAELAEFKAARAALPDDANLMVFVSPEFMKGLQKSFGSQTPMATSYKWMAYSATVLPEGIAFDYQCPMDASKMRSLSRVAGVNAFDLEALKVLPEGAYGFLGISEGGKYYDMMVESVGEDPSMKHEMERSIAEFEKETGILVQKQLVPALQGDQILAVYPGPSGKPEDLDMVVVISDRNGADPSALAAQLRAYVERKSLEANDPVSFVETSIGGERAWEIDSKTRTKMLEGVSEGMSPGSMMSRPDEFPPTPTTPPMAEGSPEMRTPPSEGRATPSQPEPPAFLKNKTIVYAELGHSVVLASSRELLAKAVAKKSSSLANDAALRAMQPHVVRGSQSLLFVNLHRIMKALEPKIEENMKDGPISAEDLTNLFGDEMTGLVVSGKFDGDLAVGRMLLPLNFERLIELAGDAMKSSHQPPPPATVR